MSPEESGLGKLIWAQRTVKGLTQKKLAELIGVSRSAINEWESGRTKSLRGENLYRLAEALDMNPEGMLAALGVRLRETEGLPPASDDEARRALDKTADALERLAQDLRRSAGRK